MLRVGWRNLFSSCAVVSVFGSGEKLAVFLSWRESFITTGKKRIQSSVWRVRDHYYDRKKKIQSSVCHVCLSCHDRYICISST
jgi:hypothetical protein